MNNKIFIHQEIEKKKLSNGPYYPPPESVFKVRTDVDEFPYRRFFRGKQKDYHPNVWEREAGFSPIITRVNTQNKVNQSLLLDGHSCFQMPCSTILPCKPDPSNFQESSVSKVYVSP